MASKDQKAHQKQLKDEYLRAQQAASASRMIARMVRAQRPHFGLQPRQA